MSYSDSNEALYEDGQDGQAFDEAGRDGGDDAAFEDEVAFEVVDDLAFDEGTIQEEGAGAGDPFAAFVATIVEVAAHHGASGIALDAIRGLLATDSAARAWREVLCGQTEEYGACGATGLDEWSAALIARTLGIPSRTESIRRALRTRGVAAFGLVADAA